MSALVGPWYTPLLSHVADMFPWYSQVLAAAGMGTTEDECGLVVARGVRMLCATEPAPRSPKHLAARCCDQMTNVTLVFQRITGVGKPG